MHFSLCFQLAKSKEFADGFEEGGREGIRYLYHLEIKLCHNGEIFMMDFVLKYNRNKYYLVHEKSQVSGNLM